MNRHLKRPDFSGRKILETNDLHELLSPPLEEAELKSKRHER
jgi:hypothetical protein